MSHSVTKRVRKSSKMKGSAFNVLLSIAEHAQVDGYSHPGNRLIAEESHISERSVERIVRTLSERGDVYMAIGRGRGRFTRYIVTSGLTKEEIAQGLVTHFGFTGSRAEIAAGAILTRQKYTQPKQTRTRKNPTELTSEKASNLSGFIKEENPTLLTGKPDRINIKPDTFSEKPDRINAHLKEVLEPCEPLEPEEGTHDASATPSRVGGASTKVKPVHAKCGKSGEWLGVKGQAIALCVFCNERFEPNGPVPVARLPAKAKHARAYKPRDPVIQGEIEVLMAVLVNEIGKPRNEGPQKDALRWMLEEGYSTEELKECLLDQKNTWTTGRISWLSVQSHIASWRHTRLNRGQSNGKGTPVKNGLSDAELLRRHEDFVERLQNESRK